MSWARLKMSIAFIFVMLSGSSAMAESFLKFGTGVFKSANHGPVNVNMFSLGYRDRLIGMLVYQYEGGIWFDSAGEGRKTSAFFDACLGLEVRSGDLVVRSVHGPTFISTPDAFIGGYFPNFNHDLYLGIRDKKGNAIGVSYKHISNAGLMPPNIGRDLVSIDLAVPW